KDADLEGARAQLPLVDDTEGDERASTQAGEPVGEEEEPAAPVDPDAELGAMAANRLREWARRAGWKHTRISHRSRRPIEGTGDEPVKSVVRRLATLCGDFFARADLPMQTLEASRRPPVGPPQQPHHGGHDQGSDQGGVDGDGQGQPKTDRLDQHYVGEAEGEEDRHHDGGGARDQTAALLQSIGDGLAGVTAAPVLLLDPADQEHLVIHGEPEDEAEEQDRNGGIERSRREVQQRTEMTLLEDPDEGSEGGADRQDVHDDR